MISGGKLGKSFKLLILDADNTLWNGVIGEDGFSNINFRKKQLNFVKKKYNWNYIAQEYLSEYF